jgi:hypothetical protein
MEESEPLTLLDHFSWDVEGVYLLNRRGDYLRFVLPVPLPLRLFEWVQRLKP